VSQFQLQAFDKNDSILYVVQLQSMPSSNSDADHEDNLPDDLQQLLQQFAPVLTHPLGYLLPGQGITKYPCWRVLNHFA
jgi:hypothetical protein